MPEKELKDSALKGERCVIPPAQPSPAKPGAGPALVLLILAAGCKSPASSVTTPPPTEAVLPSMALEVDRQLKDLTPGEKSCTLLGYDVDVHGFVWIDPRYRASEPVNGYCGGALITKTMTGYTVAVRGKQFVSHGSFHGAVRAEKVEWAPNEATR